MQAVITSIRNPFVQRARLLLSDRKEREQQNLAVVEGVRLAEEVVESGLPLAFWLATPDLAEKERGARVLAELARRGVEGALISREVFDRAADTQHPQGLFLAFAPRHRTLADLVPGLVVLADGLTDPGNLGTLIRTADALGAAGLVTAAGGVDPYSPKVVRSAMGSLFRLPVVKNVASDAALAAWPAQVVVAEADGAALPWEVDFRKPTVLVVGSEAHGPSAAARQAASVRVRIPMPGGAESLNATVAASLLLYEALRQRTA